MAHGATTPSAHTHTHTCKVGLVLQWSLYPSIFKHTHTSFEQFNQNKPVKIYTAQLVLYKSSMFAKRGISRVSVNASRLCL